MPTQCSRDLFGFAPIEGRRVEAAFDGGDATSDAGALLLDRAIGLMRRFAACFDDGRTPVLVEHSVATMVAQRTLAGKLVARRKSCAPLAGKSTLNRLEHAPAGASRYHRIGHDGAAIERLFVDVFLEAHKAPPRRIVLDLDATDDPLHGHQEGRFFHGYYDCHCYLPLYVFCGSQMLAAKLRRSNIDASAGAVEETLVRVRREHKFRTPSPHRRGRGW
jgi:Transposase DDE domain group 1